MKLHTTAVQRPTALAHCVNPPGHFLAPPEGLGGEATWALGLISCTGSLSVGIPWAPVAKGGLASFAGFPPFSVGAASKEIPATPVGGDHASDHRPGS